MKNFIFILGILITAFMSSCKPEKVITKNQESLFKEPLSNQVISRNSFIVDNSNSSESKGKMLEELVGNQLPMSAPQTKYPTWQSYNDVYKMRVQNLSPLTKQFCSQLFLSSYNIPMQPNSTELTSVVESHIEYLVSQNFKGYKLLYQTMVWLKSNGENSFVNNTKSKIASYAKPTIGPSNPKQPDSKIVLENEKLKQDLDKMLNAMKENDSYLLKIQEL